MGKGERYFTCFALRPPTLPASHLRRMPPASEQIASLASRYGLLTVSIPRAPAPGQVVKADALPPEPVEIWRKEIQALRACMELWDSIANGRESATERERLGPQNLRALGPRAVHLKVFDQDFQYCPVT